MLPAQAFSAASQSSIAVLRAVPAAIRNARPAAHQFRDSLLADRARSIRRGRRWALAAQVGQADQEHGPDLALDLDLADHPVPASALDPAQAEQHRPVRHLVRSALLRVDAADARSIRRPKKAQ